MHETHRPDPATYALLTLPPMFWAGNAIVGRMMVGTLPPLMFGLLRWLLAIAILLPFAWGALRANRQALRAEWKFVALAGFLGVGCYNSFQYIALHTSSALNVTLIGSSGPVFILAVGALVWREPVRAMQWVGALVSLAGVAWVIVRGEPMRLSSLALAPGDLIMLGATVTWSLYTWILRKHRPSLPFTALLAAQMVFGALAIAPFALAELAFGAESIHWNARAFGGLAYVALFPSLAAYYCWDRGVARAGAALPVYFANLTPVFAALMSLALLGEAPRWYHAIGMALIVAGIHLAGRAGARKPG